MNTCRRYVCPALLAVLVGCATPDEIARPVQVDRPTPVNCVPSSFELRTLRPAEDFRRARDSAEFVSMVVEEWLELRPYATAFEAVVRGCRALPDLK